MPGTIETTQFRRILSRNFALPLVVGALSVAVFVGITAYLVHVLNLVEHTQRVISNANETAKLSVDMETGLRGFLISGDESFLAPYVMAKARVSDDLVLLKELVAERPAQVDRLRRVESAQRQWYVFADEMIALRRANGDYVGPVRSGRGKVLTDGVRTEYDTFVNTERRLRQQRYDDAYTVVYWSVGAYLLFSAIVAGALAMFGRRALLRLSGTYTAALEEQVAHAETMQRQAWLRTGQTELAVQTAGQESLGLLARSVLAYVTRYLGGAVAAMYVREDSGALRRVASYGFDRESEQREQVLGRHETLVGQAASENRTLTLDNVPGDYVKVTSGLGSGAPRHLLVVPFANEGVVNGVIEIGFLHKARRRDGEFLQLAGESIGAAVAAAQYRQRLQEALAETQQLNEELQVQQEELRTANEELEEQSRVLEESQTNLENQQAELETTNDQLAEQALNLDQKNAALTLAQDELRARAQELERASRYKSEFLANMSHELRTPLNSSLILAKLLSDNTQGNLNDEQVRFAKTIYSAGNDLLQLINDILDISKVEAGKLDLVPEEVPLRRTVESLAMVFEPLAMQKKLAFRVDIDQSVPGTLHTDRQRLEQVLKNLLSNAVKFTDAGEVSLKVTAADDGTVRFIVTDSGIGIAQDQHERIFDAFHQADGTTSRRFGGTGLGLSISRDLTGLLGGTLTVSSKPGVGSTFTLCLPRNLMVAPVAPALPPAAAEAVTALPPAAEAEPAPPEPAFPDDRDQPQTAGGRTVLVIEDDPAFARILYQLAHDMDYRCMVALTAEQGLRLATEQSPDAILLDMRLPDRSGLSVLQTLKERPETRHIPVHVVSSQDNGGEALHLGAIGYALKPTTREQLEQVFRKLEDKFTQKIKRILLVEDDERQRESVVSLIADDDVHIDAVGSGQEAMALLRSEIFDCMIIDLKLPDMQGNELLEQMSREDICSFPPVIVYTGRNLTRTEEADLMKYSRSIIIKGARSPERLLDEVTLFLHRVESQLSSERQSMLRTVRSRDRVFEGRTILLVDDDVRNVFALTSALEQRGAIVEIGRNGFEALSKLDEVPGIDLVLMDIMMPGMDGLEATRRIRADGRFDRLPIIAVTAKAMKDDQEQCIAAGANDYLAKPIDLTRLYSLLRVWMPSLERT
ncbi:response regulator [Massilia sp. GCM10020059]|uniref:histidine kinase n=1 Tax=Massilia agrisoli TaxID=2892444 RepID=A0ABS8IST7_9BURK|nr:response regulator [Massilia agrisoli]MCC6071496.1 response regulator [Massilia agrisoli]